MRLGDLDAMLPVWLDLDLSAAEPAMIGDDLLVYVAVDDGPPALLRHIRWDPPQRFVVLHATTDVGPVDTPGAAAKAVEGQPRRGPSEQVRETLRDLRQFVVADPLPEGTVKP